MAKEGHSQRPTNNEKEDNHNGTDDSNLNLISTTILMIIALLMVCQLGIHQK